MLLLGTIMAQTTSRLLLHSSESHGEISPFARALTLDYVILPFLILLFLGLTIMIYYLKPQETSMFMRRDTAVAAKEDNAIEIMPEGVSKKDIVLFSRQISIELARTGY